MQKITPFLWFENQAEEAVAFYLSVFQPSRMGDVMRYGEAGPGTAGSIMAIEFELDGNAFIALNGGPNPQFAFTPAISFFVKCTTQDAIDAFWLKLSEGGETMQCGWLRDKFGICWQIVPTALGAMLRDKDPARAARVMRAMLPMKKLDIDALQKAYAGQ